MQSAVEHGAGAVAGEHTAGAVGPVGAGRQAEDQDARLGIAEGGHRFPPIFPVPVSTPLHLRDPGGILSQTRAAVAIDDLVLKNVEQNGS